MFNQGHLEGEHLLDSGGMGAGSLCLRHTICLDQMLFSGKKIVLSLDFATLKIVLKFKILQNFIISISVQRAGKKTPQLVVFRAYGFI